jgi:SAM-dependent MidA family methyltransferase
VPAEPTTVSIRDDRATAAANLNRISAHGAGTAAVRPARELRADGDPAAVGEIADTINASGGRIPFSLYMELALYGKGGYYSQAKVSFQSGTTGGAGDFSTSPEQSDDFSRCLNVAVCAIADAAGRQPFNLVELGAGSGRMMKDTLAAMRNENAAQYRLVHAYVADYPDMHGRQRRILGSSQGALAGSYAAMSSPAEHAQDLSKVCRVPGSAMGLVLDNNRPTVVVTNELHDAMPADVIRNHGGRYEQKFVALGSDGLTEAWSEALTGDVRAYIAEYGTAIKAGNEIAISTAAVALQQKICDLVQLGGFIAVDYGRLGPSPAPNIPWAPGASVGGDTGAVYTYPGDHNPLQMPGELDLTYRPDFDVLRRVSQEEGMDIAFAGLQAELLQLLGLPTRRQISEIFDVFELTDASLERLARARVLNNSFRALVATRGVRADFSTQRPLLPGYREFCR